MRLFLLVMITCVLPFSALASTYHGNNRNARHPAFAHEISLHFPTQKQELVFQPIDKRKEVRATLWKLQSAGAFDASAKPVEIWFALSKKPRLFHFREWLFQRPYLRPGVRQAARFDDNNIVMVPTLSSLVFMLTMMVALITLKQHGYIRKIKAYTRPLVIFRKTRYS